MLFLLWSNTTPPLISVGHVPSSPVTGVWQCGGTGLCNGEKDVAAKPLWKMPDLAVVGSQQIERDTQITLLLFKVSREYFFFLSPKRFDSC